MRKPLRVIRFARGNSGKRIALFSCSIRADVRGKGTGMNRFLGLVILTAGLALPAHAQASRGTSGAGVSGMTASNTTSTGGGGGYSGGGFGSGAGSRPTRYPVTQFGVASVSGSLQDFIPSTFLAYDKALATGRDILANPPKTVAEAAHNQEYSGTQKARIALIQDANGNPVIVAR